MFRPSYPLVTTRAVGFHSPAKRSKTHHTSQEVDDKVSDEVVEIEDFERWGSPLTELSSAPHTPPLPDAASPVESPATPHPNPRSSAHPSPHPSNVLPAFIGREVDDPALAPTPATVQKQAGRQVPEPGVGRLPAWPASLVASGSRTADAGASVSTNKKLELKGKKKHGPDHDFNMDDALLNKRLVAAGPNFDVENDRITHQQAGPNSRATMSHIFGGNPQRMISYPSAEKRRIHGFGSALLFPSRKHNPYLPTKMGERGLLFRLDQGLERWTDDEGRSGPYHLMMHHTSEDYCYFGLYEFVRVDPVTKDEWLSQPPLVRHPVSNCAPSTHTNLRG